MLSTGKSHLPVLAQECLDALNISCGAIFIDGTFGRGGHSQLILNELTESGKLLAFDQDLAAIAVGRELAEKDKRFSIIHESFSNMVSACPQNLMGKVDGILLDIGVSSPQLDEAQRGFSFMRDGPLDMRMNQSISFRAYDYLQKVSEKQLSEDISVYGEERHAKKIANMVVQERKASRLEDSTLYLADLVIRCGVKRERNKHPATRTFQALRIVVNNEVGELEKGLEAACQMLSIGGRLAVISFHGLEHRVVKSFIRHNKQKGGACRIKQIGRAIGASRSEVRKNVRSRSAYLRVLERVDG